MGYHLSTNKYMKLQEGQFILEWKSIAVSFTERDMPSLETQTHYCFYFSDIDFPQF